MISMSMVLNTVVPTRLCGQSSPTGAPYSTLRPVSDLPIRCSVQHLLRAGPCLRPTQSIRRVAAFTTRSPRRSRDGVVKAQAARPVTVVHAVSVGNRYTYVVFQLDCCFAGVCPALYSASNSSCARRKVFDSEEAQADMRFVELQEGEKKILVISAVAPGSTGEKAGSKHTQQMFLLCSYWAVADYLIISALSIFARNDALAVLPGLRFCRVKSVQ